MFTAKRLMSVLRLFMILPLILIIFGVGFFAGASNPTILVQAQGGQPRGTEKLFVPFWDAWRQVHERYVDPLDDNKLVEGAISGMVNAVGDRNTAYMNPRQFELLNSELSGSFEGIGATIRKDQASGGIAVISTIANSPARNGGLKVGDVIMTVDGVDITRYSEQEVIMRVRGKAGTEVKLGVIRKGERKLTDVKLVRAKIVVPVVEDRIYEGNIGYVRLSEFSENAASELRKALEGMDANNLNGLILDLRDNPGGGLQTSIDIGSMFVPRGQALVLERGRAGTPLQTLRSTGRTVALDVPMVVLINGASASASELVGGALQDYKRATLIGTQSFGKGSVQVWSQLEGGGGLRVTIARFFTPFDRIVNERGLTPDILIGWDVDNSPNYDPQLAEALRFLIGES